MDKVASSPALSMTEGWPDEESALSENEVAALNVAMGMGMSVSANTEEAPERHTVADLTSIGPSGRASTLPPGDLMSSVVRLQPVLEASEAVEEGSEGSNAPTDESDQKVASFYIGGDDGFSPREDKVSSPRSSVVGPRLVPLDEGDARGKAIEFTPPDGGYGWVVALSACFINVWIVGFVKSYGVLYVEVRNAFPEASAYHASWLPSLLSTVGLLIAPVTGTLCRRFTSRKVSFLGGLMCFLGLLLGSQAATMNQLILSTGLLTGLGAGLTTTPGVLIVSLYFDKRRTFASALCVSGNALGGFFLPPLVDYLLGAYGLRGTFMILAAMQLHICALSMLYRPISHHALVQAMEHQQNKQDTSLDNMTPVMKEKLLPGTPASLRPLPADDPVGSAPHTPLARSRAIWQKMLRRRLNSTTSAENAELQRQVSFLRSSSMMNSIPDLTRYARSWSVAGDRSPTTGSRSPVRTNFPLGSKSSLFHGSTSKLSLSKLRLFAEHPSVLRLSSDEDGRVTSARFLRGSSRRLSQQSRVMPAPDGRTQLMRQVSIRTVQSRIMTSVLETEADSRVSDKDEAAARHTQDKPQENGVAPCEAKERRLDDEVEVKRLNCCLACLGGLCDCSLFRDPLFVIMAMSVFLMSCGAPFTLFFLPAYAETVGIASGSIPTMLSISSIVDLAGRLSMGFFSDLGCCQMSHIYVASGLAAASAVLTVPHMRSFSGLTVALAMYGFGVGSWFVLIPPILAQHHGAAHLASSYGLVRLFNGLMNFISPQLNGMLYDYTKDYKVLYMFMGSCMVGASLLMVLTPLVLYFRKRDPNQEDEYIIKNPA